MEIIDLFRAIQTERNADIGFGKFSERLLREQYPVSLQADIDLDLLAHSGPQLTSERCNFATPHQQRLTAVEDDNATSEARVSDVR